MIKLYLVRHGETDGNSQQWFQGASDVPLNATGIEQARRLSHFMKDIHFDAIYTSTLSRAYTTAEIIAEPSSAGAAISGIAGNQLWCMGTPYV
jgi:alpha-ribazole phosphatase